MGTPLSRQELTDRNIQTMRDIFTGVSQHDRAVLLHTAALMINQQRFETPSAQWAALQAVLRILINGGMAITADADDPTLNKYGQPIVYDDPEDDAIEPQRVAASGGRRRKVR